MVDDMVFVEMYLIFAVTIMLRHIHA